MPTFAVVGASGLQGGNVIKALLSEADSATGNSILKGGQLRIRALTRVDPGDNDKANAIRKLDPLHGSDKGQQESRIEVVQANLDDKESLVKAFTGCDGVFGVTDYWVSCKLDMKKEEVHANNIGQACLDAKVPHLVFSTLEHSHDCAAFVEKVKPLKKHGYGEYRVPHLDGKANATKVMVKKAIESNGDFKVTCLYTSFYLENLVTLMKPARNACRCGPCAKWQLPVPVPKDYSLPFVSVGDIGRSGAHCLLTPPVKPAADAAPSGTTTEEEGIVKNVYVQTDCITISTLAEKITKESGRKVVHWALSPGTFGMFPFAGADDLANMFQFKVMNKEFASKRVEGTKEAGKETTCVGQWDSIDDWVKVNAKGMF